jgi:predicted PurR-regulated permease PerM
MPAPRNVATSALVGIWTVLLAAFVIVTLYVAQDILVPLALAGLITFLLSPLVTRIERWIGRIAAVLLVVLMLFGCIGAGGWILTRQLVDLAEKLPDYKGNIETKLRAFKVPKSGAFTRLSQTVEDLKKDLPGAPEDVQGTKAQEQPAAAKPAVPVKVVETVHANPFELVRSIAAPLLGPLGTAGLVLVLVIFMLLQREDLRSRVIRLIGQGRISSTKRAMDDASQRVSHYLFMQLVLNLTYGVVIAIGLTLIGVPNALLWGAVAATLRFIPYVGAWISAFFPIVLSFAVSKSWTTPLYTIGLFLAIEMICANLLEPLLYGSSTGVSSVALIVAAMFWTWLWGPLGLLLATPMTVCLVVMGRHVPRLEFLSVLLSDEHALAPHEECYHRMLTFDSTEPNEVIDSYLKTHSLTALYDSVLIPVITASEMDFRRESLDEQQRNSIQQSIREIVEDLGNAPVPELKNDAEVETGKNAIEHTSENVEILAPPCRVLCLPARAEHDELAGMMLAQLLNQQGFQAENAAGKLMSGELLDLTEKSNVDAVCISVVPPSTVIHARYLCTKLRARFPTLRIMVGLWSVTESAEEATRRLRESGADEIVISLEQAVTQLAQFAAPLRELMTPAPIPVDDEERVAALNSLNLIDTKPERVFDRITAKLARIFDVPVALVTLVDKERQFFKAQTGLPDALAKSRCTTRDVSVCGHVIASNDALVVEDIARDRRFANNPLLKEHGFRFYAGVPLRAPNGQPVGSLCVLDAKPRKISEREKRLLQVLAEEVMEEFKLRAENGDAATTRPKEMSLVTM